MLGCEWEWDGGGGAARRSRVGTARPAGAAALAGTRGQKRAVFVQRMVFEERLCLTQGPLKILQQPPSSSRRGTGSYSPRTRVLLSRGSTHVRGATGSKCSFGPSSNSLTCLREKNVHRGSKVHRPVNVSKRLLLSKTNNKYYSL